MGKINGKVSWGSCGFRDMGRYGKGDRKKEGKKCHYRNY
jgi:hypothetical protein